MLPPRCHRYRKSEVQSRLPEGNPVTQSLPVVHTDPYDIAHMPKRYVGGRQHMPAPQMPYWSKPCIVVGFTTRLRGQAMPC